MATAPRTAPRLLTRALLLVLLLGGVWRAVIATHLPCISRDGVVFAWYARDLGTQGLDYLRSAEAQQHPLFPLLLLAGQRVATACGAPDTPLTWQIVGQVWCGLAGLAVILLTALLTQRLVTRLELPVSAPRAAWLAALLAALLPLNVWLSADVMSDELHLALYLGAACLIVDLRRHVAVLGAGVLSGLAFLTRPEGMVPVVAAGVVLLRLYAPHHWRHLATRLVALAVGFVVCAAPYWAVVGELSHKKNPFRWDAPTSAPVASVQTAPETSDAFGGPFMLARLERHAYAWYWLIPEALHQLFRAGRVVIPLLALLPLVNLRRRFFSPVLLGSLLCLLLHLGLTLLLLGKHGYLDPRHMLVPVALLTPFAAFLLARLVTLALERQRRFIGAAIVVLLCQPLALYSLRIPNGKDGYLVEAARWLRSVLPADAHPTLLSGSSGRRIAFYADLPWEPWYEHSEAPSELLHQLEAVAPAVFALELGPEASPDSQRELAGNRALLDEILATHRGSGMLELLRTWSRGPDRGELRLYSVVADKSRH